MLQQKWRMPLMDTAEEIISEVDDVSIEALKIEKQSKGTETEKIKTEYPGTVKQLQKV